MEDELKKCKCGGDVIELIRDEDEGIIKCYKCKKVWPISELWNARTNLRQLIEGCREDIAKTLCKEDLLDPNSFGVKMNSAGFCNDYRWEDYQDTAQAAISAIIEKLELKDSHAIYGHR